MTSKLSKPIHQKKICLLGDFAVGKTSLIRQFVEGKFDDRYLSTIGVKISRKDIERERYFLRLLVWDLAGGGKNQRAQDNYLRGAAGALIVCDLTRPQTLSCLTDCSQQFLNVNRNGFIHLIANKADLLEDRVISNKELKQVSEYLKAPVITTSAKSGAFVEEAFSNLANLMEGSE